MRKTSTPARAPVRPQVQRKPRITEAQLQDAVLRLARLLGWECYHTFDSRKSAPGFPDLCLCRPPRLIMAEVKVGKNTLSPAQTRWLGRLGGIPGVEVFVWRERDWLDGHIDKALQ